MSAPPTDGLYYLATPYTRWPWGHKDAFDKACEIAASLFLYHGLNVYSPIAHSHPIHLAGNSRISYERWIAFDTMIIPKMDALIVAKMHGWESSTGVQYEITLARKLRKPIYFLNPKTWDFSDGEVT